MNTGKANLMACGSKVAGDIGGDTPGRLNDTSRVGASGDRRRIKIEVPVNVTPADHANSLSGHAPSPRLRQKRH